MSEKKKKKPLSSRQKRAFKGRTVLRKLDAMLKDLSDWESEGIHVFSELKFPALQAAKVAISAIREDISAYEKFLSWKTKDRPTRGLMLLLAEAAYQGSPIPIRGIVKDRGDDTKKSLQKLIELGVVQDHGDGNCSLSDPNQVQDDLNRHLQPLALAEDIQLFYRIKPEIFDVSNHIFMCPRRGPQVVDPKVAELVYLSKQRYLNYGEKAYLRNWLMIQPDVDAPVLNRAQEAILRSEPFVVFEDENEPS